MKNFIKCAECGRFISYIDIESGAAVYYFVPDSYCAAEESWFICKKCKD